MNSQAFIRALNVGLLLAFACFIGCHRSNPAEQNEESTQPTPRTQAANTQLHHPAAAPSAVARAASFLVTQTTHWRTVQEFEYTLPEKQIPVHFKLEIPEAYNDPGDFIRIRIQVKNQPEFVLDNEDGWMQFNMLDFRHQPDPVYDALSKRNVVKSKYVLVIPSSTHAEAQPLVILRSWGYASDPERLHVLSFQPSGKPIILLNTLFALAEISDLDGDRQFEIAGRPCPGEAFGRDLLTYTPFHVYKIPRPLDGPAKLSIELSKAYNETHYYGWAGADCSEALAVVLHPPGGGKPLIMTRLDAEKLMDDAVLPSTKR